MKRTLLTTALALLCAVCALGAGFSQTTTEGVNLSYNITSSTALTVGVSSVPFTAKGSCTIPSEVTSGGNTYRVTSIEGEVFWGCSLTKITIPNSVTWIGDDAFYYCEDLKELTIPNSVTWIGESAFLNCDSVTKLTISSGSGSGLTDLSKLPLSNITEFIVSEDNTKYSIVDGILYDKAQNTLIKCPKNKTGSVTIPNSVTSIEDNAFNRCYGLTEITIPNSVTSIKGWAFEYCESLTKVTIPSSVTSIGEWAFYGCPNLDTVEVFWTKAEDIPPLNSYSFENKSSKVLTVPYTEDNCYSYNSYWKDFKIILRYKVTYNANGGVGEDFFVDFYQNRAKAISPCSFTKKDYIFKAWCENSDGTGTLYYEGDVFTASEPTTLYAIWQEIIDYNITVNLNGGELASGATIPPTYTVKDEIILPTPTKANSAVVGGKYTAYTFTGWLNGTSIVSSIPQGTTGNITLTAMWGETEISSKAEVYSISVDLNGGELVTAIPETYTEESATIVLPTPTKANSAVVDGKCTAYAFAGWHNGTSIVTEIPQGSTGNITLTATWDETEISSEAKVYSISVDLDGGELATVIPPTYTEESATIVLPTPTKESVTAYGKTTVYTFAGWHNGTEIITSIPQGTTGNITLTATWAKTIGYEEYNITADLNGGELASGVTMPESYTEESETIALPTPTKESVTAYGKTTVYTFAGWHNGTTTITSIPQGTTGNINLTAQWSETKTDIKYNIGKDLNGGTLAIGETIPTSYTVKDEIILPMPTKANSEIVGGKYTVYTFAGWNNGTKIITEIPKGTKGNVYLKAIWNEAVFNETDVVYNINVVLNGGVLSAAIPKVYTENNKTIVLPTDVTKANSTVVSNKYTAYTFAGWSNGTKIITEIEQGATGNITLTATWDETIKYEEYNITVELKGGEFASGVTMPKTYTSENKVILPEPIKENKEGVNGSIYSYTFTGWKNGTDTITEIPAGRTGNIQITATWKVAEITEIDVVYNIAYEIAVAPMPITNNSKVLFTVKESGVYSLKLYSLLGKAVASKTVEAQYGKNVTDWQALQMLPKGVYFLTLTQNGKQVALTKVVF